VNVIQLIALAALLVLGLIGACALIASEDREREPDLDSCSDAERKERLEKRQQAAAARMKREGIKSLLDGRPAWQRIVVMSEAPKPAKVIPMRKAGR
jgi:hypothetical protein